MASWIWHPCSVGFSWLHSEARICLLSAYLWPVVFPCASLRHILLNLWDGIPMGLGGGANQLRTQAQAEIVELCNNIKAIHCTCFVPLVDVFSTGWWFLLMPWYTPRSGYLWVGSDRIIIGFRATNVPNLLCTKEGNGTIEGKCPGSPFQSEQPVIADRYGIINKLMKKPERELAWRMQNLKKK